MKFNIKKPQKAYPLLGTLFHRTASGKYVNADVSKSGPFYYRYKGRDGKYCCLNLETEDRNQAVLKANWLFYALSQFEGE